MEKNYICQLCGKFFIGFSSNNRTKFCSIYCKEKNREKINKEVLSLNSVKIDKIKFQVFINNKKIDKKRSFEIKCDCNKIFKTTLDLQIKKEFPWKCKSCSIKLSWSKNDYRKKHLDNNWRLTKNNSTHKALRSRIVSNQWKNPEHRKNILSKLHTLEVWRKCIKPKWSDYNGKKFRSSWEVKVAKYLDFKNIFWEYEPKFFLIKELNKKYIPDFYCKDLDLWIEVKGYCSEKTLLKYNLFKKEYGFKTVLIDAKKIDNLENINEIN